VSLAPVLSKHLLTYATWDEDKPAEDSEAVGDPYKTLFISRLVSSALVFDDCLMLIALSAKECDGKRHPPGVRNIWHN